MTEDQGKTDAATLKYTEAKSLGSELDENLRGGTNNPIYFNPLTGDPNLVRRIAPARVFGRKTISMDGREVICECGNGCRNNVEY